MNGIKGLIHGQPAPSPHRSPPHLTLTHLPVTLRQGLALEVFLAELLQLLLQSGDANSQLHDLGQHKSATDSRAHPCGCGGRRRSPRSRHWRRLAPHTPRALALRLSGWGSRTQPWLVQDLQPLTSNTRT